MGVDLDVLVSCLSSHFIGNINVVSVGTSDVEMLSSECRLALSSGVPLHIRLTHRHRCPV